MDGDPISATRSTLAKDIRTIYVRFEEIQHGYYILHFSFIIHRHVVCAETEHGTTPLEQARARSHRKLRELRDCLEATNVQNTVIAGLVAYEDSLADMVKYTLSDRAEPKGST